MRPETSDLGASTLETIGMTVVAAALTIGVVVGVSTGVFPERLSAALCRLSTALGVTGACTGPVPVAGGPDDADLHPGVCMLKETEESYATAITIGFVEFGENSGFIIQEFSDDTVRATVTDGASFGVTGGVASATFDTDKLGSGNAGGVDVELGANLSFAYGDTWEFENLAEWDAMHDELDAYLMQQTQFKHDVGGGSYVYTWLFGEFLEPPKDPQVSFSTVGVEVAVDAVAGVRVPAGANPKPDPKGGASKPSTTTPDMTKPGSTAEALADPEYLDPGIGVSLSATAGGEVTVETNHESGEKSYTFALSGSVSAGADAVVAHASAGGTVEGAFTTTYDKDGELTQLAFGSTYALEYEASLGNDALPVSASTGSGGSQSVVTTTTLAVTDENRAQVERWVSQRATGATLALPFSAMLPTKPSDDPFQQLLYEEGKTSRITYDNVVDEDSFGLAVKKGWELGFSISAKEATATKAEAEFLGAPRSDAVRPLVDDTLCK
jgi:hypothetical protein